MKEWLRAASLKRSAEDEKAAHQHDLPTEWLGAEGLRILGLSLWRTDYEREYGALGFTHRVEGIG